MTDRKKQIVDAVIKKRNEIELARLKAIQDAEYEKRIKIVERMTAQFIERLENQLSINVYSVSINCSEFDKKIFA